jgi:Rps23 Pro-64 3,4-dihydroxylase Tpa1-like proline 4-hydroxylase
MNLEDRIYFIPDFLEKNIADQIYEDVSSIPTHWFRRSIMPANESYEMKSWEETPELQNDIEFQNALLLCEDTFIKNEFAYRFRRSFRNHYDTCKCGVCKLDQLFGSNEILERFSCIVNEKVISLNETFLSKYQKEDFLSIHHDKGKGHFAFIYQLTKDWNPVHGGLLTFVEGNEIKKTISPHFNSLSIFRIKDVPITDHFVSRVVVDKTRMAYTGWFLIEDSSSSL